MPDIKIYTKSYCPYCHRAKALLDSLGAPYQEIDVEHNDKAYAEMLEVSQQRTVPQIFIGDYHVGGCTDLQALHREGRLEPMLNC